MTTSLKFSPPVIAHRGASHYAPENTMAAFQKAASLGINWIEFDVMQAASGEAIIFHDELLDRTTNAKGEVADNPYSYLETLDAGSWFGAQFAHEKIPTLPQVLNFIVKAKISANIEIKARAGDEEKLVQCILQTIASRPALASQCLLFSSFSIEALYVLRKHSQDVLIGLLLDEWRSDWKDIYDELQCVSLHVNHDILTPILAKNIKAENRALLCYTVNDQSRAAQLFSWGVDAVFSDIPDQII